MSRRHHQVTPADRRLLRWLPITLLFQHVPDQPHRLFREQPQIHRLVRAGLITASYDTSARALTLNRSERAQQALDSILLLPPDDVLPDPRR